MQFIGYGHSMAQSPRNFTAKMFTEYRTARLASDILKVVKVSLATGGRFLEIANLKGSQLSKYKITYTKTNGKKNRTVPIGEALYKDIYK